MIILHYKKWRFVSFILLCSLVTVGLSGGYRMQAAGITAVLLLVLKPWDLVIHTSKLQAPFAWLGKVSYSLYLVHLPVILLTSTALEHWGLLNFWSAYVIKLALILTTAALFYHLFERSFLSTKPTADKARAVSVKCH